MFRKLIYLVSLVLLLSPAISLVSTVEAQPKNIIFFIGDGMGFEQVKATGMYVNGEAGTLSFESFPYKGELTNHAAGGGIPDSAAAGTALATGVKVNNGVISMAIPGDGSELETLLEYFKDRGKSTGLVTTKNITDATPAAFGAHEPDRNNAVQIAGDYLMQTQPNVLFGGGGYGMSVQEFENAGYIVVTYNVGMQAMDTENVTMVSGQFGNGPLPYEPDLGPLPHLTEMTDTALRILDNDPDGFFLMVEGGKIDTAGHSNLTNNMILETIEFDNAVQVAIDWATRRSDTLVLVTADHETGGLTVLANNGAGVLPTVTWSTGGHSGANIPVYAWGVNAEMISGVMDNTEIFSVVTAGPEAWNPNPADGAIHLETQVFISWSPGRNAVTHDIYFGDSFEDVNDGTGGTFRVNQAETFYVAGSPGYPYPDGLVPGTTYYWRIDEVEADGTTHKGHVWSFSIPPSKAYNPYPSDGSKFIDTDVILSWTAGTKAKLHHVYFGDNYSNVNDGTGGTYKGPNPPRTTYSPGPLEFQKTYYWRIDEFDGKAVHKGDIWSFTTARDGGGLRADYYHWTGNPYGLPPEPPASAFRTPVLSRIDPQINFNWGFYSPDPSINADNFSAIWTGEIEAVFSEPHIFYANADAGVKLWINDKLIIDNWASYSPTEINSEPIELIAGQRYPIVMWWYESSGLAKAELRWESPNIRKQLIPQAAFWPSLRAGSPSPPDGATCVTQIPVLLWAAGDNALQHDLYFGTDQTAVADADKTTTGIYQVRQADTSYIPPEDLEFGRTYFWRIDEVDTDDTKIQKGIVWSFTVADFILVDDFEDYTDETPDRIFETWIGGLGDPANGALIGYPNPDFIRGEHFVETQIVHGDGQSMPYFYDNDFKYSEATVTLTSQRDWTKYGVGVISLWFRGFPGSVGSFVEGPVGTYTMTAAGADIWGRSDEFHYAYKQLSGPGSIIARVDSIEYTDYWAKAGVMIRNTLDADSANLIAYVTPDGRVGWQGRGFPGTQTDAAYTGPGTVKGPHWLKMTRQGYTVTAQHSSDGENWEDMPFVTSTTIMIDEDIYIGLALTSHNADVSCEAKFSDIQITGTVSPDWTNEDIGILTNAACPMYVSITNANGATGTVYHTDPSASEIDVWTEWPVELKTFADLGVDLTDVERFSIGFGDKNNPQSGGSGKMYFDDIRLYRPAPPSETE